MVCVIDTDNKHIDRYARHVIVDRQIHGIKAEIVIPRYLTPSEMQILLDAGVSVTAFAIHLYDCIMSPEKDHHRDLRNMILDRCRQEGFTEKQILRRCPLEIMNQPPADSRSPSTTRRKPRFDVLETFLYEESDDDVQLSLDDYKISN